MTNFFIIRKLVDQNRILFICNLLHELVHFTMHCRGGASDDFFCFISKFCVFVEVF